VLAAGRPAEAIDLSEGYDATIHLMVTDVIMPGMSGRALADRMSVLRPEMRVLYVSGYTDDAIFQHGMQELGLDFLQKPFSPKTLAKSVRDILDRVREKHDLNAAVRPARLVKDLK
jgi:two-component system cell cycle sensor histidine kinase/response regulator CckA